MKLATKLILILIVLAFIDMVIPIPITSIILIYVLLQKPPWFIETVHEIYDIDEDR
jgi:hypothetical protein